MKKNMKLLLAALTALTVVYLAAVVHAQSITQQDTNDINIISAAVEYKGEPEVWYTPEELGITSVWDFGLEDATWVQVAASPEVSAYLDRELPIFKFKDKFWKMSGLRPTPGDREDSHRWQLPAGIVLSASWIVTGAFLFKQRKANE